MRDLLLSKPKPCPPGTYCLTTVIQTANQRYVYKMCVDEPTCCREWFQLSSDKTSCQTYNHDAGTNQDLACSYCCTTAGCNPGAQRPATATLYRGAQGPRGRRCS